MQGYTIFVTGGSGFLGQRILKELLAKDSILPIKEVRVLHLTEYTGVTDPRITLIKGDIREPNILETACNQVDGVIHAAALVDWGTKRPREVFEVNFTGTKNVIEACSKSGVRALVFTSSLDAVYTGKPLRNVNEKQPYPKRFANMYCESKSKAESLVLNSNGDQLRTCALRPADIWGESDPYHLDALIDMAKGGFYVRLGNGRSKCQHVYVGNCAHAHVLAVKALLEGNSKVGGEAYFITDGEPENFFKFFDRIVKDSGHKIWPNNLWLPRKVAYVIGAISEFVAMLLRPFKYYNPKFSRFAVNYTCTDYTFNSDKAQKDFGFNPKIQLSEAIKRTTDHYQV